MSNTAPAHAGVLFQYTGLIIASLAGAGAANWLKDPAPWLHGVLSGEALCRQPENESQ